MAREIKDSLPPIAIIGMACRFPGGVNDPASYAEFLRRSGDGVVETPKDRWDRKLHCDEDPAAPGRTNVQRGGFLKQDVFAFEPNFFGISGREAGSLDPQQRLLLEVSWESFEDARVRADQLAGSKTGVFIGGFSLDNMIARFADIDRIDNHIATSSSMTLLSNRLSYTFDLRGPSMTVDTACSSSLVAVHLACESLRRGECEMALAGGVNLMLLPNYQIVMSKGHFLAADGRSKTFEADADGYGRGEGAGVLLLKPLEQALANGDPIRAVIRGSGINQDGATSGIPVPNPDAQAQLSAHVCERAAIDPVSVAYVEAHGTGTAVGDPLECRALALVYGQGREQPLAIGSVKANIGHLEAGAGIAGLIKAAISVQERTIFPHRPIQNLNPAINFEGMRIRIPQQSEPWPNQGPARAAVNSFGYGGTNAHVIVEEAPVVQAPAALEVDGPLFFPISAHTQKGLTMAATQTLSHVDDGVSLADLCAGLVHERSHLSLRAGILAQDHQELRAGLLALAQDKPAPTVEQDDGIRGGKVWVFPGMGPQWWKMGAELYTHNSVFRAALDETDAHFRRIAARSILADMFKNGEASLMPRNDVAQPANLMIQVGLVAILRAWGIEPDAILGHSVGEVAAAWAAGALTLEDAVLASHHRSRLQQLAAGQGGMLAVGLSPEQAQSELASFPGVVIAAFNSPEMVTLAGPNDQLDAAAAHFGTQEVFAKRLRVEVPYHSPAMDPMREELLTSLSALKPMSPQTALYSTALGRRIEGPTHDADYWWTNTRGAVRLQGACEAIAQDGHRIFLEVGPHPVLAASIRASIQALGHKVSTHHCLKRLCPERESMLRALACMYVRDLDPNWEGVTPRGSRVELPKKRWRRERHWDESLQASLARIGSERRHPMVRRGGLDEGSWGGRLGSSALAWAQDHQVDGAVVLPGAAWLELLAAGQDSHEACAFSDISFSHALVLTSKAVSLEVQRDTDGRLHAHSLDIESNATLHASATPIAAERLGEPAYLNLENIRGALDIEDDISSFYQGLAARGLSYGPAFQGVKAIRRSQDEALVEVQVTVPTQDFRLHPALLDSAFQSLVALVDDGLQNEPMIPVALRRLWYRKGQAGEHVFAHIRLLRHDARGCEADLQLCDTEGKVLADLRGLRFQRLTQSASRGDALIHSRTWVPINPQSAHSPVNVTSFTKLRQQAEPWSKQLLPLSGCRIALHVDSLPAAEDHAPFFTDLAACFSAAAKLDLDLAVLTTYAQSTGPQDLILAHAAAITGMTRVAMNEFPQLGLSHYDLPPQLDSSAFAALMERGLPVGEELALRDGQWLQLSIAKGVPKLQAQSATKLMGGAHPHRLALVAERTGRLDSLSYHALPQRKPLPHEVQIEVDAASLNFKDVMKAMGMLPDLALDQAYLGYGLGLEASGRVVRKGDAVEGLKVGDPVYALTGGALATHLNVDANFVVPRPTNMDAHTGSCVFVFLTAWYALKHAGRIESGESILIHSAAGGVGLAAIQIAQRVGLEIFATAGTHEKREHLRGLGVEYVYDSRSLDFAEELRRDTQGAGVDLVLNSLAGAALNASISLLKPGGRFLELGKIDIAEGRQLSLLPFNEAISFHAIDLDRMATLKPKWFAPVAREVMDAFSKGHLMPLPTEDFAADQAIEAFRRLALGEVVGKVVLNLKRSLPEARPMAEVELAGGPWLVTGGLSGFGLCSAQWLVSKGVSQLVLVSRRGLARGTDAQVIAALRESGVEVLEREVDVCKQGEVEHLCAQIENRFGSLHGVIHAAALLDDQALSDIQADAFSRVYHAKVHGAEHLDRATRRFDLAHFWLFDSIAAWLGNPNQGSYAAANAALAAIATQRRQAGLPGTSIAWGALADAGMVARDAGTEAHLRGLGIKAMPPGVALNALISSRGQSPANLSIVDINWARWRRAVPGSGWERLGELGAPISDESAASASSWAEDAAERLTQISEKLVEDCARIFRSPAEEIDLTQSLRDHGLDSIVAVEISLAIEESFAVTRSTMDLLAGRTILELAHSISKEVVAPKDEASSGRQTSAQRSNAALGGPEEGNDAAYLRSRICVTAPYDQLIALHEVGEDVRACVALPATRSPHETLIPFAEAGRHLAILGSMACARSWPTQAKHAWPVAVARMHFPDQAPNSEAQVLKLSARALKLAPRQNKAQASAHLETLEGDLVAELEVEYHVIEQANFELLFADHIRPDAQEAIDPYRYFETFKPTPLFELGCGFHRLLPPIEAAACAGHFPRMPAMPVAVLGGHAIDAVLSARQLNAQHGATRPTVLACEVRTHNFLWAGQGGHLKIKGLKEQWSCVVENDQGLAIADFALTLSC